MATMPKREDKEVLSTPERWLELLFVVLILLLLGFFMYHQIANTGFFTSRFGSFEMICLYGPIVLATAAPIVRALTRRRNPARLPEAVTSLLTTLTALWFLIIFPFNFAHFTDALPFEVRFVFSWLNDDIAKIPLVLQIIVGPLSALVTLWRFLTMRWREPSTLAHPRSL
jgi:hypothetical protein